MVTRLLYTEPMNQTENPFDDIRDLIARSPGPDHAASVAARQAFADFPGPQPVLGRWMEPVAWLAGWQGTDRPTIERPLIAVFAGTHGVVEGFTDHDIIKAAQSRVEGLTEGQAVLRGMSSRINAAFKVYEMGLEYPVPDITQADALSERDCAAAMAFGMEVVAEGADIIVLGNAGFGSATAAAAIAQGLYGGAAEYWAGAHDGTAEARIAAVERAANFHAGGVSDPLECLRRFGGRDISGLVGAILAARQQSIPVILDGFVVCTAAAVLHAVNPDATAHCLAGHLSAEPAHGALLDRLGLTPLHNFGIPTGDGTGAAYALSTLRMSVSGLSSLRGDI